MSGTAAGRGFGKACAAAAARRPRAGPGGSRESAPVLRSGWRPDRARRRPSFWAVLAFMFLLNWLLSAWFLEPAARTQVSYTFS